MNGFLMQDAISQIILRMGEDFLGRMYDATFEFPLDQSELVLRFRVTPEMMSEIGKELERLEKDDQKPDLRTKV